MNFIARLGKSLEAALLRCLQMPTIPLPQHYALIPVPVPSTSRTHLRKRHTRW